MYIKLGKISIEVVEGDIVNQSDIDAVVNAANAQLMPGGGVAGAIHRAAGPGLVQECRPLAPIRPGEAVITGAHKLPNKSVIHCLGPVFGHDNPSDILLSDCYKRALHLADENRLKSIAFPSISTGVFGYPMREASQIAFNTIKKVGFELKNITRIRFVLFGNQALEIHQDQLKSVFPDAEPRI